MKNATMKLQIEACNYMERTYGKDWEKKNLNRAAITNAFIEGYKLKESEDKTAKAIVFSEKTKEIIFSEIDKLNQQLEDNSVIKMLMFGLEVKTLECVPDHLAALVDDEGNVLSFIDIQK